MKTFREALLDVTKTNSTSAIAQQIGVPRGTFNNQIRNEQLPAETLVAICRAYDVKLLKLLLHLGLITEEEYQAELSNPNLDDFTLEELSKEVYVRAVQQTRKREALKTQEDYEAELAQILADVPEGYDLAARKARKLRPGEERGIEYYE